MHGRWLFSRAHLRWHVTDIDYTIWPQQVADMARMQYLLHKLLPAHKRTDRGYHLGTSGHTSLMSFMSGHTACQDTQQQGHSPCMEGHLRMARCTVNYLSTRWLLAATAC
jgi:hypothetical protein